MTDSNTGALQPTQEPTGDDALLPCPFCARAAVFDEVTDEDSPDFGGHFVRCTHCLGSLGLQYANKEDPRPLLAEKWNCRTVVVPSSLVDDEDERGFTPSDYAHTAELLRSTEAIRKATASNNHNIILAALDRCAAPSVAAAAGEMMRALEEISEYLGDKCRFSAIGNKMYGVALAALTAARRAGIRTQGK